MRTTPIYDLSVVLILFLKDSLAKRFERLCNHFGRRDYKKQNLL